jgi:hypothetical protein
MDVREAAFAFELTEIVNGVFFAWAKHDGLVLGESSFACNHEAKSRRREAVNTDFDSPAITASAGCRMARSKVMR